MPKLAGGAYTFLFTDIEGSTRLFERMPDAMQLALARHDELLYRSIESNGGFVFKTVGDAFCAVFESSGQALSAAIDGQLGLRDQAWGETGPLRVRMAIHTGEAAEREDDFFGPTVNRAARLMGIGHGGQVLLSAATYELVRDELPAATELLDLGDHRLRDLDRAEHVRQVVHPNLRSEFPPLRSLESFPTNLPIRRTRFVGRETELAEVKRQLGKTRLLTLTGAGGSGKTRLALQAAADLVVECPEGVWWIDLAPLSDAEMVTRTAAGAFGLREEEDRSAADALIDYLRDKRVLLVVDNCEHLIDASAELCEGLLSECPDVRVLATSREALGTEGEISWVVPTLSVPSASEAAEATPDRMGQYESVELFIDRAVAAVPEFSVSNENAPAVAEICYRLDGIPLALELAAARVRTLSAESILKRLDERFRLLTGGPRTVLPRQQTLLAAIDWSFNLLDGDEQQVLVSASVFHGGWDLEAAEAVCSGDGAVADDVLDLLTSLADKSMVVLERDAGDARYRMLETIREYALDRPEYTGILVTARSRHAEHFAVLAEAAEPALSSVDQVAWLERLDLEHENMLAAIGKALEGDVDDLCYGLRIVAALWRYWDERRLEPVAMPLVGLLLARPQSAQHKRPWIGTLLVYASLARVWSGDFLAARPAYNQCLAESSALGDEQLIAWSEYGLGALACDERRLVDAQRHLSNARELFARSGDDYGSSVASRNLGRSHFMARDYAAAEEFYLESAQVAEASGDRLAQAIALGALAGNERFACDLRSAAEHEAQAQAIHRELGSRFGIAASLVRLGEDALVQGNLALAARRFDSGVDDFRDLGYEPGEAKALSYRGVVAWAAGDLDEAKAFYEQASNGLIGVRHSYLGQLYTMVNEARLGLLVSDQGYYGEAEAHLSRAIRVARRDHHDGWVSWCLLWLGEINMRRGRLDGALKTLETGLEWAHQPIDGQGRSAGSPRPGPEPSRPWPGGDAADPRGDRAGR